MWQRRVVVRAVTLSVAVLFLFSALLNAHRLVVVPYVGPLALALSTADWTLAGIEFALGMALIRHPADRIAGLVSIGLLAGFAVVSGFKWSQNYQACRCFGVWDVSPGVSLLFAATSCGALLWLQFLSGAEDPLAIHCTGAHANEAESCTGSPPACRPGNVIWLSGFVLLAALFFAMAQHPLTYLYSRLAGSPFHTEWYLTEATGLNPGRSLRLRIYNLSDQDVAIVGGRGAGCSVTQDLPLALPSGTAHEIGIDFPPRSPQGHALAQYELVPTAFGVIQGRVHFVAGHTARDVLFALLRL